MNEGVLKSRSVGSMAFDICNYMVLAVVTLTVVYPFWNLILISFAEPAEMMFLGFHIWLDKWSTTAWQYVLEGRQVGVGYFNSVFRTVLGTPLTLVVTLFAAYPLSKRSLPYRKWITIYFVVPMLFSGGIIPTYLVVRGVGLIDSRLALILPSAVNVFYVIIMRNYLMTLDDALEESALVDGAGYGTILFRIIAPLARPVVAVVVLWTAVWHWNSWFDAMIYIYDNNKMVLQILVRRLIEQITATEEMQEYEEDLGVVLPSESVKAATVLVTVGPIIFLYPVIQRHFIKGIMLGSLKG